MKKIVVNESLCIGCGACVALDNEHFDFNSDGLSSVKKEDVNSISPELASAVESCPTSAIKILEVDKEESDEECLNAA